MTRTGARAKRFLHVGCGPRTQRGIQGFDSDDWTEIRFDIDETVRPDIVGTLTDMRAVASGSVDAVFSSHDIEHLHAHEVHGALTEFRRVLKDDGFVVVTCPDLQSVCEAVANDPLLEPLYVSPAGPISPIDVLFGHRACIAAGKVRMAHRTGFAYSVLDAAFRDAGFPARVGLHRPRAFDLWLLAFRDARPEAAMRQVAARFIP